MSRAAPLRGLLRQGLLQASLLGSWMATFSLSLHIIGPAWVSVSGSELLPVQKDNRYID